MPDEFLSQEEVKQIAKNYIFQKEATNDVIISGNELSLLGESLVWLVLGKARKNTIDSTNWQAGVVEEYSFRLQILNKDKSVISYNPSYNPSNWPPDSPPTQFEQVYPLHSSPTSFSGELRNLADIELKKAQADLKKARAEAIRSKTQKSRWKI